MSQAHYYRAEAERCRTQAAGSRDPADAARWRQIAKDYVELAEAFDALHMSVRGRRAVPRAAVQSGDDQTRS